MRIITPIQIACFVFIACFCLGVALGLSTLVGQFFPGLLPGGAWNWGGAVLVLLLFVASMLMAFRGWWRWCRFPAGPISRGSSAEFCYHVYLLFFLMLFYPLMRSHWLPVPLVRVLYLALGARMGANSYTGGVILDPPLVTMGRDCLLGMGSLLVPHIIAGQRLEHHPITLGDRVTVGVNSTVMAGACIGDDAVVAMHSVVTPGTRIPAGEEWGGVPARPLVRKALDLTPPYGPNASMLPPADGFLRRNGQAGQYTRGDPPQRT